MLMLPGVCRDLLHFGVGHVAREDPADTYALAMDFEHDLRGALARAGEELLQDDDHELHRGVVVVQQHYLEHRWRLQLASLRLEKGVVLGLRHAALSHAHRAPGNGTSPAFVRSRPTCRDVVVPP